jgi:hypothetical protein
MKLKLTVELEIKGVSRTKLEEDMWAGFTEELDGRITDTYFLVDDSSDEERELEVNVVRIDPEAAEKP